MGMRCPSCQEYVDPSALDACPNCGHGFQSSAIAPAIRPAGRPKLQIGVELGLAIDRTGSSAQFATGIRTSVPMILKPVCAKARWCRVWLQSHGDEDCGEHPVLLTSGGAPEQAIADLQTIVFEGGGDPEEHHLDAIDTLAQTTPWTSDPQKARGALIAFLTAESKPSRSGKSPRKLGEEIREHMQLLYLVCEPTPRLEELCTAANGLMFPISNDPRPRDLQKIAAQVAASVVLTVAKKGTIPSARCA